MATIPSTNLGSSPGTGQKIYITDPGWNRTGSYNLGKARPGGGTFRAMGNQPIPQGGGRGMTGNYRKAIGRKLLGRQGGVPTRNYPMGQ